MTNRLIVALDVPGADAACELAQSLRGHVAMVKIGLESFVGHGPPLVRRIRELGVDVFLDLKLHDIPRTAAAAAAQLRDLDVRLLTLHAAGGSSMVTAVRQAVSATTQVVAVTVLTSLGDAAMHGLGFAGSVAATATQLGRQALQAGADGLVCSAHELQSLRPLGGLRVVPGVRPSGSVAGDQRRVATPEQAVAGGASWVVVGRPVLEAADPVAAACAIAQSLA